MGRFRFFTLFFVFLFLTGALSAAENPASKIEWKEWSDSVFQTAKKENKFVILDLHAVWCHWCHVMEETTYQDPKVAELIGTHYLAVEADQDSHVALSNRYEDYGWPATVIFSPEGKELAKRRGYIEPAAMASLLKNVVDNPSAVEQEPEVKASENAFLTKEQQAKLRKDHDSLYDVENAGWVGRLQLIFPFEAEYALIQSEKDKQESERVFVTLDRALNLLDPVWGGFFQYSDEKNWKSPHYEKIMWVQADYMRIYSLAYALTQKPKYLKAAQQTASYIKNFWTDKDGGIYTSQDADLSAEIRGKEFYSKDDAGRRALGMPKIDRNIYSRENGLAITGLISLYDVTGQKEYLEAAKRSAEWILKNRIIEEKNGLGFSHGAPAEEKGKGPYLSDTLAMGRAFLALYASTGDRQWLVRASSAADYIERTFKDAEGGYSTAESSGGYGVFQKEVRNIDENTWAVRFTNLLFHYSGKKQYREMAEHAMRYLASPVLLGTKTFLTGILIAGREMASQPVHVVIVGHKDDSAAQALYAAGLKYPAAYKRIEWWDKREGPMPNPDVKYPELGKAAAFACADKTCSLPVFEPGRVAPQLDRIRKKGSQKKT